MVISTKEKNMEKLSDEVSKEQLIADFRVVVADAEALLKATANQGGEKLAELRAKAEESIKVAKANMTEAQAALVVRTKKAAKAADAYVHESPWHVIGIAAAIGLAVGLLIRRS
jgi:ElaB/YqjD/DUF883 family membrane-anchored ribosome-binding protein